LFAYTIWVVQKLENLNGRQYNMETSYISVLL